ncbi:hypothetical protein C5Y97_02045 [Blastopirellula marina]|uniref:Uncharacterized protein n=1 Tax=Blastopirellula marina TaxID=124 RepID=A0A2S8GEK5_9BACT|nr:hypothetical protein C5Y98_02045 [Blastopirellula marina]PTL46447.1 hypothetical protein C5Y97_02045 [Blastopirellula marina]
MDCQGTYRGHLQGVAADGKGSIFWSFTDRLVKTDTAGKSLIAVEAPSHQGDLCFHEGKLYVAVNLGQFNKPAGEADSWVFVYDADTLKEIARHPVTEVVHGAGGMDARAGHFLVIGGLPPGTNENYVYEYDADFKFVQRHVITSGYTLMGIQTATFHDGYWWFGCYGKPAELLRTSPDFKEVKRWPYDAALGIVGVAPGKFLVGRGTRGKEGHTGQLVPAVVEEMSGLKNINSR